MVLRLITKDLLLSSTGAAVAARTPRATVGKNTCFFIKKGVVGFQDSPCLLPGTACLFGRSKALERVCAHVTSYLVLTVRHRTSNRFRGVKHPYYLLLLVG